MEPGFVYLSLHICTSIIPNYKCLAARIDLRFDPSTVTELRVELMKCHSILQWSADGMVEVQYESRVWRLLGLARLHIASESQQRNSVVVSSVPWLIHNAVYEMIKDDQSSPETLSNPRPPHDGGRPSVQGGIHV